MVKQAFPWYGSKVTKQSFIQPKLIDVDRFVIPFGGSASILLNREATGLEVLNDIDNGVMNFFEVLRDRPKELVEKLCKTPYHEGIFEKSKESLESNSSDQMEKAIAFFVTTTMAYNAGSDSFAFSTKEIRCDRSQHTSRYQAKISDLEKVAHRLHRVQFMNRDAREVIRKFQKPGTLQYWDPPYPHNVREAKNNYQFEMSDADHKDLLDLANNANCKIAISSYQNGLYDSYLNGWYRYDSAAKGTGATNSGKSKVECLYTNYIAPCDDTYQCVGDQVDKCSLCEDEVTNDSKVRSQVEKAIQQITCVRCSKGIIDQL